MPRKAGQGRVQRPSSRATAGLLVILELCCEVQAGLTHTSAVGMADDWRDCTGSPASQRP